ncbi:PAS domain-containing sensor histidine kinase [Helicobacter sp. MIT 11-5569]|uniref:sensor histidine kinase n=1 Tax=Helicobacter sp. MIT 11-5569 TaxID=1548151 RepID=UPI00051F8996|nr:HAMP domain-containing sensor histidine kinase [Helicobacter sp. MIT 11-5569]TLD83189.1 PAS domain-containing sensor histidine kinase [Helicobacter sp. MIT 11-5569]
MEWLTRWNENYSLTILILGLLICLVWAVLYLVNHFKRLSNELKDNKELIANLQSRRETVEFLSKELVNQIEHEVAQRLKSDYAHNFLFESSLNAIIICQDEDLKIIKYNSSASVLFGMKMLNYNILELFKDMDCKTSVLEKIDQLKKSKQRQNFRINLQTAHAVIPVMASINFLEFAQKTTLYFTFIDISDVAKLEEELQNKHLMLTQKSKEEEMGRMLGNVAHQWKQPLNALYLACQNLKEIQNLGTLDDVELERYLQIMIEQIKFMSNTVEAFRAFYIPSTKKEEFEICSVIQNTLDLFYSIVDNNIAIRFLSCEDKESLKINAIKSEFQNIIIILIDNAIEAVKEHLKEGGIEEGKITIRCLMEENIAGTQMCMLYIRDNGGGIRSDIARKIFDTFFTTKKGGAGIGLSIVQMFLESMHGRISFINEKDGVEFKVELPISNQNTQEIA